MRIVFAACLVGCLAATTSTPAAHPRSTDLRARLQLERHLGRDLPERTLVVRFDRPLDAARRAELEDAGVRFQRVEGRLRHVGPFYGVRVASDALARLVTRPDVRALLPATPSMVRPAPWSPGKYNKLHLETTARAVWPLRDPLGNRLLGEGQLIADIDSGIDVFHPSFFRADAGLHAWVDTDGDGALTPGTDGVDLDQDGAIADDEVLRLLDASLTDPYTGQPQDRDGAYSPGFDWLYLDSDGDGHRDKGGKDGFTEQFPAYGEPLFTADDIDGDGVVREGEKLARLGSSKVRAVFIVKNGKVFRRGVDLVNAPTTGAAAMHGTGVAGILVGGRIGDAIHGVAPDADLLMIDNSGGGASAAMGDPWSDLVTAAAFARDEGARMLVHEYGTQFGEFADGSSDWEEVIDALSGEGIVQATATHNFAGAQGHAQVTLAPGEAKDVPIVVTDLAMYGYAIRTMITTLRWRGAAADAVTATLTTADGATFPLDEEQTAGAKWYSVTQRDTSARGTSMMVGYVVNGDRFKLDALPSGSYSLRLESAAAVPVTVHASIGDDTGYAYGIKMLEWVSDSGTLAFPSSADTALSVGASVGNEIGYGEVEHGLKTFSGRGPRIDGALGIDVVAPEDHWTAYPEVDGEVGLFGRFGGTSGALPQVAGAVALLLQAEPSLSPDDVRERLHASAGSDAITGETPNDDWGYGRLLTHRLVTGADVPDNEAPHLLVEAATGPAGQPMALDAGATTDDGGASGLTFRWDRDYDGAFDEELTGPTVELSWGEPGTRFVLVEVEDELGFTDRALARVDVTEPLPPEPQPELDAGVDAAALDGVTGEPDVTADATFADTSEGTSQEPTGSGDGCSSAGGVGAWPWMLVLLLLLRRKEEC
jgi:uncharacterized protein (TIGR03382 family)